jgi:Glycosyl hydrolase family 71
LTRDATVSTAAPATSEGQGGERASASRTGPVEPPVLAHYYIWFTPNSWNRAKTDIPLLGRYSSDDADVMRTHIRQAQTSGIDGFIVSWKSTEALDARLATLVEVAGQENFKLEITYQGLDFNRELLPVPRIVEDLEKFADTYAGNPVFELFDKPVVIVTGTPSMVRDQIAAISDKVRDRLLVLASEKDVERYASIADVVDGNLYYWSSVNPQTMKKYTTKLRDFAQAVRAHGGIWIAPVAPGFDAQLVGGESVVDRRAGQTLRDEWAAAVASEPDAIGVISWNEFSENTHIEPSEQLGSQSLDVLAELTGATALNLGVDSSDPSGPGVGWSSAIALGGLVIMFAGSIFVLVQRGRGRSRRGGGHGGS